MKLKDTDIAGFQLCEGENIKIYLDKDKNVYVSAPNLNNTNITSGGFSLCGKEIEIKAGRNIHITTAHPNILTIGCDFDVEKAIIARLEKRVENLERMVAKLIKEKSQ